MKLRWPRSVTAAHTGMVCVWLLFALAIPQPSPAESVTVAVAANFARPLRALQAEFESATGHDITAVSGATGQLYAQIVGGAPFDVLLAADQDRPRRLVEAGFAEPGNRFTYAAGRLALWSADPDRVHESMLDDLGHRDFRWLAIANPEVAPYGRAAQQVLDRLGAWETVERRLVRGQSVAQTFAFIATGNAEIGFVALSQALAYESTASYVVVPAELHDPIRQDAVLLRRGETKAGARDFMTFLRGPAAVRLIERFGYGADPGDDR
jgi:molybdate transport system substrate-binding protein